MKQLSIKKIIIYSLPLFFLSVALSADASVICTAEEDNCEFYVSNDSTDAYPCTKEQPCQPAKVWQSSGDRRSVKGGDTVTYLNGEYTGANYMINPPEYLEGASENNLITIRAQTEGQVLLNGQWQTVPIHLFWTEWLIVEGFNACCSDRSVVSASGRNDGENGTRPEHWRSTNNTLKRIVAWDSGEEQSPFDLSAPNTLCEDCAAFGVGRKMFVSYEGGDRQGDNVTCRRCWGRWEGSTTWTVKMTFSYGYNVTGSSCENCLATHDNGSMPSHFWHSNSEGRICRDTVCSDVYEDEVDESEILDGCTEVWRNRGGFTGDGNRYEDYYDAAVYGSIAYLKGAQNGTLNCYPTDVSSSPTFWQAGCGSRCDNQIRLENVVSYIDPANTNNDDIAGFQLEDGVDPPYGFFLWDATSVTRSVDRIDYSRWIVDDYQTAPNLEVSPEGEMVFPGGDTIFEGGGARICNQYKDRAETDVPLWPWPMQERIKAATESVGPGSGHQHRMRTNCDLLTGICIPELREDEHEIADVMGNIVEMFGEPPAECRSDGGGDNLAPAAPGGLTVN